MIKDRKDDFDAFRLRYSEFVFSGFSIEEGDESFSVRYAFRVDDEHHFEPSLSFPISREALASIDKDLLHNVLFHIGLVELISYWKLYCPRKVLIECASLDSEQVRFFSDLLFNGLGEFRYLNGIDCEQEEFVPRVESSGPALIKSSVRASGATECLVPVGGGKDSAVVLSLLHENGFSFKPLFLNEDPAASRVVTTVRAGAEDGVRISRKICPKLLECNRDGALNGHTPFSALLAFVSNGIAALMGVPYVVLANESSANEPTVPGTMINHQYSKSWHFEEQFADYFLRFVSGDVHYFSLLRPWNEARIVSELASRPALLDVFRSCNVGSKQDRWCADCPKCLFVYTMCAPYVGREKLVEIFGADLLAAEDQYPTLVSLAGMSEEKPFECVGAAGEVMAAIKSISLAADPPALVVRFVGEFGAEVERSLTMEELVGESGDEHGVPEKFLHLLN